MNFNFKKVIAISAVSFGLVSVAPPASAFWFATEPTQVASWAAQYVQMVQEFNQLVKEYNSLNGTRGMASLVNNPALRRYLPSDYRNILSQGYGDWQALRAAIDNPVGSKELEKRRRDQLAIDEAMALASYREASRRFADIQVLLDKINDTNSPDAKDMADLQARIQAEQVMLQNETAKLAMLKTLQDIQKTKMQEQARINDDRMRKKPGVIATMRTPDEVFSGQ